MAKENKGKVLSVIVGMVVYNEEIKLKEWLEKHSFIPKVIIVNQHSTDKTVEICRADERVVLYHSPRFECIAEPDLNLLQQLSGAEAMLIMSPDESITEENYREMSKLVTVGYSKYKVRSYYIARNNFVDDVNMTDLFKTQTDQEGKDWQLRVALGDAIHFENVPHTLPAPKQTWAYLDSKRTFIEHRKTLEEERQSLIKRSANSSSNGKLRDANHLQGVLLKLEENKDA